MDKSDEAERHVRRSRVPCLKHKCVKCCIETRMPLSRLDIKRILKLGFRLKDFVVETEDERRLKNSSGRCVFLSEKGCKIHPYRPEGCRLYPLVYDEDLQKVIIDRLCPYGDEFKIEKKAVKRLRILLERIEKEAKAQ